MTRVFFASGPKFAKDAMAPPAWAGAKGLALHFGPLFRFCRRGLVLASFCLLMGCVDSVVPAQAPSPVQYSTNMTRRPGVSPSGASVDIASFSGGPSGVSARFIQAFDAAAKAQDIVMADPPRNADYFVRGYLSAMAEPDGTSVAYVLDVFNADKHRIQRIEGQILVKRQAADPWSVVGDHVLGAVAAKSAAALAAVLTNTPQAIAAAQGRPERAQTARKRLARARHRPTPAATAHVAAAHRPRHAHAAHVARRAAAPRPARKIAARAPVHAAPAHAAPARAVAVHAAPAALPAAARSRTAAAAPPAAASPYGALSSSAFGGLAVPTQP